MFQTLQRIMKTQDRTTRSCDMWLRAQLPAPPPRRQAVEGFENAITKNLQSGGLPIKVLIEKLLMLGD